MLRVCFAQIVYLPTDVRKQTEYLKGIADMRSEALGEAFSAASQFN